MNVLEYKVVLLSPKYGGVRENESILNALGLEGWDLVSVVAAEHSAAAYLKRQRSDNIKAPMVFLTWSDHKVTSPAWTGPCDDSDVESVKHYYGTQLTDRDWQLQTLYLQQVEIVFNDGKSIYRKKGDARWTTETKPRKVPIPEDK